MTATLTLGTGTGLTGQYYDNMDFTNLRLTRVDPIVNFSWGNGSPAQNIGADTFSVRWTGKVVPLYSETYTFYTTTDDGARLWVNGQQIINNWADYPPTENRGTITLQAGQAYDIRFDYYENGVGAVAQLSWSSQRQTKQIIPQTQLYPAAGTPVPTATSVPVGTGLRAEIYDNKDLTFLLQTRIDPTINFNWGSGAPLPGIGTETFSVRWTGSIVPRYSETYTFYTISDDGVRLWVNGQQIINNWTLHGPTEDRGTIALQAGRPYDIRLEYFEDGGGAQIQLTWSSASQARQVVPQSQLLPPAQGAQVQALSVPMVIEAETSIPTATLESTFTPTETAAGDVLEPLPTMTSMLAGATLPPTFTPTAEGGELLPVDETPTEISMMPTAEPLTQDAFPPTSELPTEENVAVLQPTYTPSPTATSVPGEQIAVAGLCEAIGDRSGALAMGEQLPLGSEVGLPWTTGLRFCALNVPQNARIVSAWVEFLAANGSQQPLSFELAFDDAATSAAFTNNLLPSQRFGVAFTTWTPEVWFAEQPYRSPELAAGLSSVVMRPDWQAGNDVSLLIRGLQGEGTRLLLARPGTVQLVVRYVMEAPLAPTETPTEFVPTETKIPLLEPTLTETPLPEVEVTEADLILPESESTAEAPQG
jgi:hypothetical protein